MEQQALVIALIGVLGIGAQWIAWRTGWPAIALMLVAGIFAGPVTGLIDPHAAFGSLLEPAISIAVAVILFEGGLSLNFRELRKTEGAVTRLAMIGIPVGWVLGALACYYIAGLVWPVAILFAGIMVVTGPTVVLPLLRQSNVAPRPRAILKWEAIVNDPFGALCAVITYEYLRRSEAGASLGGVIASLLAAAVLAGLIGYAVARAIAWAFPRGHVPEYLKAPVLLVAVIGTFVLSNLIQQETGLLAVTVMGIALANMRLDSLRDVHPFKENITVLLISGVFVLLSAQLDVEVLRRFEWRFAGFLVALLLLVRPATVLISLAFSRVPWNERLLIAWIAPRGVVAVAVSGLLALRLDRLGYSDGDILVTLSFAVVVTTIIAHGFSIRTVARWLKVTGASDRGLLIVGSTEWSLALADHMRSLDVPVLVSDSSWQRLAPDPAERTQRLQGLGRGQPALLPPPCGGGARLSGRKGRRQGSHHRDRTRRKSSDRPQREPGRQRRRSRTRPQPPGRDCGRATGAAAGSHSGAGRELSPASIRRRQSGVRAAASTPRTRRHPRHRSGPGTGCRGRARRSGARHGRSAPRVRNGSRRRRRCGRGMRGRPRRAASPAWPQPRRRRPCRTGCGCRPPCPGTAPAPARRRRCGRSRTS
jgi:NhaP-type Na+/H+ or K+/H+ antiporter